MNGVERVLKTRGCFVFVGGVENSSQCMERIAGLKGTNLRLVSKSRVGDDKGKPVTAFVIQKTAPSSSD